MKKWILLPVFLTVCCSAMCQIKLPKLMTGENFSSKQDFELENDNSTFADGRLTTTGVLTIKAANINLSNVTLTAKKIIITTAVRKLLITGTVKLVAEYIEVQTDTTPIEITGSSPNTAIFFTTKNLMNPSSPGNARGFNVIPLRNMPVMVQFN